VVLQNFPFSDNSQSASSIKVTENCQNIYKSKKRLKNHIIQVKNYIHTYKLMNDTKVIKNQSENRNFSPVREKFALTMILFLPFVFFGHNQQL